MAIIFALLAGKKKPKRIERLIFISILLSQSFSHYYKIQYTQILSTDVSKCPPRPAATHSLSSISRKYTHVLFIFALILKVAYNLRVNILSICILSCFCWNRPIRMYWCRFYTISLRHDFHYEYLIYKLYVDFTNVPSL